MASSNQTPKAFLLVGGLGTRLRSVVADGPKPLATVGDRPFLELLVRQLASQGVRRLVMCTGYKGQSIREEFGDGNQLGVSIEYSLEPAPLGTAGAVKFAASFLGGESDFLVMNGDSFVEVDFRRLMEVHQSNGCLMTMAVVEKKDSSRYGTVRVAQDGRVTGFVEKIESESSGLINAGVYLLARKILDYIPESPASLEKDIFPKILGERVYAVRQGGVFIDIGTPDDYRLAQSLFERLDNAARGKSHADNPR
jgi:D-glycero-alpha-D-manno-heptose 1-phosphate guanylyltransferase